MRSLTVMALLLGPATLAGQEPIVAAGTRVRLTTQALEKLEGTVTESHGDTIVLRQKKGLLTLVRMSELNAMSVVRGRRPDPLGGLEKGMLFGGGTGLVILTALCGEEDIDPGPEEGGPGSCSWSDVKFLLMGTGALAVAGGAVGLVVGTIVGTDRWRPVGLPPARVSVRPLGGGAVGVGFSLSF